MANTTHAVPVAASTAMTGTSLPSLQRAKVPLTKEARKVVSDRRRQVAACYQEDLDIAWVSIDKAIADIASTHHKSVQCVQKELHMGRSVLHTRRTVNAWNAWCAKVSSEESSRNGKDVTGSEFLVNVIQRRKSEYLALTNEEKRQLVETFTPIRNAKHTARRTSARSRVNDITGTLKCIEDELNALRSCTGLESTLCAVRGSTDTAICPKYLETEGLDGFMGAALRIDKHDFTARMEGYSIQGIRGAAHNHRERVVALRSELRNLILSELREITGNGSIRMRYKDFWPKIVRRYKVDITGWPSDIPFTDLSDGSRSLSDLESLLRKWKDGTIQWRKLTPEEYKRLENDREEQIKRGEIAVHKRQTRSDAGTKRRSYGGSTQARKKTRTASSALFLLSDSDNESVNGGDNTNVPSSSNIADENANGSTGPAAPPGPAGSSVASSTSNLSSDAVITHTALPSSSAAAAAISMDASNNLNSFNMGGDAASGSNDIFTGYHDNLDSLFFNFDFDETTSNMTF
ncbi:hypothetical protein EV363DRAFT_1459116 [Boletus edulis]|nr:hypothetical protein EV363DRAFT_1459116 [Boletus edulis]